MLGLHDKTAAARLNTLVIRKALQEAPLRLSSAGLVFVPLDPQGDALHVAGSELRIPSLLLRGGPELEAQRVAV